MGITGLLPFLKKIHSPVNISQFRGCTVAIDAYCWLHRGAFSCADKLAVGEPTEHVIYSGEENLTAWFLLQAANRYVYYCMKYVNYLLSKDIKPILVFDGAHLPSKRDVEKTRRERREVNRKKAAQFLREGKKAEARDCFQKCVDITPAMALKLMKACRAKAVDCIVAPYEADAQLAYLNRSGIAQIIITEDSDLLLFGCDKVMFKMDFHGNGMLIEQSRLNEVMDIRNGYYTFDKFRYMCILSGCDYLPSISGIGLAKACKVFKTARQPDLKLVLKRMASYLNMKIVVGEDYIDGFIQADNTFLYQLVFDPCHRQLVPLTPYPPEITPQDVKYAGPYMGKEAAYQRALGNIDLYTGQKVCDFDPDQQQSAQRKPKKTDFLPEPSMWDKQYRPCGKLAPILTSHAKRLEERPSTAGIERVVDAKFMKKLPLKRNREEEEKELAEEEMADLYADQPPSPRKKRLRKRSETSHSDDSSCDSGTDKEKMAVKLNSSHMWNIMQHEDKENSETEAILTPKRNKFAVSLGSLKKQRFNINAFTESMTSSKTEVKSRFFKTQSKLSLEKKSPKCLSDSASVDLSSVSPEESRVESRLEVHPDSNVEPEQLTSQHSYSNPVSAHERGSPAAFSWSKFKFSKKRKNEESSADGEISKNKSANAPFKRVMVSQTADSAPISMSVDLTEDNLETQQSNICEEKNLISDNNTQESSLSDSVNSMSSSQSAPFESISSVSSSQGHSQSFSKFSLSASSVHTVDLTDSEGTVSWGSQKFASQDSRTMDSSTVSKQTAEILSISPPQSKPVLSRRTSKVQCRVSGLSRGNGKTPLGKQTSRSDGQCSIKNMFVKFAHKSKSEDKLCFNHCSNELTLTPGLSQSNSSTSSEFIPRQILP